MSEAGIKPRYLDRLRNDFDIQTEVDGRHFSGKNLRLDAVVKPRKPGIWKNPDVALGIEFKDTERFAKNYDTKDFTKWLAQCVDYTNTLWDTFGYIYIFTCPSLLGGVSENVIGQPMFIENFMGQLGIGELKEVPRYGLSFVLHGHHRIWSSKEGVVFGKNYSLKRKFGSK